MTDENKSEKKVIEHQALRPHHYQVIEMMARGMSDSQIAAQQSLRRETLSRLRRHNPIFRAEFLRRREELLGEFQGRIQSALLRSMDVCETALDAGNIRVALAFMRGLRFQTGANLGALSNDVFQVDDDTTPQGIDRL